MGVLLNSFTEAVSYLMVNLGIWHTIISYAIGAVSIVFLFISFQMKDRKKILIINAIGSFGWTIYFMLQGDLMSGVTGTISLIRTIIFSFRDKHAWAKSIVWLFVFLGLNIAFAIFSFSSWKDIFPLLAGIMMTISFFMIKEKHVRIFSLSCYLLWMCNSLSKGYWIALASDVISLTSVIIGMIRFKKQNNTLDNN
jgi:hypothetical protein